MSTLIDAMRTRFVTPHPSTGGAPVCCEMCAPKTCADCPNCVCYRLATSAELRALVLHERADLSAARDALRLLLAIADAAQKYRNAAAINAVQKTVETAVDAADAAVALDRTLEALRAPAEEGRP